MKKILGISSRFWCTLLLSVACTCMAEAQSSVRRVPRKDNTTATSNEKAKTSVDKAKSSNDKSKTSNERVKTSADKEKSAASTTSDKAKTTSSAGGGNSAPVKRNPSAVKTSKTTATTVSGDLVTLRAQAFDEYQRRDEGEPSWQRTVYRELDVTQGSNASLYYPEEPTDGLTNFFRVVLDLVVSGRVKAYEYLDGREVFTDKYVIKVQDMLSKFQIYYTERPASGRAAASITVDESDVPSNEVLSYFIKERWEFDRTTSHYGPRVLAVCPVLHRAGDFGGDAFKYPMFWLKYEDLRPYLRQQLIVSDGMNAAPRYTMEDFFNLSQYQGDIYKVQNLRGLSLMQQYADADTLRMKRQELDRELRGFSDSIWVSVPAPTTAAAGSTTARKVNTQAATATSATSQSADAKPAEKLNRRTKQSVDVAAAAAEKEAQEEAREQQAERTGAARSVRRTRR